MTRTIGTYVGALLLMAAAPVMAQETTPAPGTLEVTVIPAGATYVMSKDARPDFADYTYGGALAYNITPILGIEGEVSGTAGIAQDLTFNAATSHVKTPMTLDYTGNVVLSANTGRAVVPFVTAGVGGLTMFERAELGVDDVQTFLTGNVGGGVKWYAPNRRWGIRGDYRFTAIRANDDSPSFLGQDTRYEHRLYVGVVIRALR
jgi:hypothetical protein